MFKQYLITLSPDQRERLQRIAASPKTSARQRTRARILLASDSSQETGRCPDATICQVAHTSLSTVLRVQRRFLAAGLEAALVHQPQAKRKAPALDGVAEAHLIALVCGTPPHGQRRWTLHLLKDRLIESRLTDMVSHETIRQRLKKMHLSPG